MKCLSKSLIRITHSSQAPLSRPTDTQPSAKMILPYIQGQSEAIRRVLRGLDIKTSFTPARTLRQILSHPKDRVEPSEKTGVVYQIPCADCDKSYVGQTGRTLSQTKGTPKSSIYPQHRYQCTCRACID